MWLVGRLAPDHKTITLFRRDNGVAIQSACRQFVVLCRQLGLFAGAAIDGSKFKAVNNRDRNFTVVKVAKRIEQVDASIDRYLAVLDRATRRRATSPRPESSASARRSRGCAVRWRSYVKCRARSKHPTGDRSR